MTKRRSAELMPSPTGITKSEPSNPNASFILHSIFSQLVSTTSAANASKAAGCHRISFELTPFACASAASAATMASMSTSDMFAERGSERIAARIVAERVSGADACACEKYGNARSILLIVSAAKNPLVFTLIPLMLASIAHNPLTAPQKWARCSRSPSR